MPTTFKKSAAELFGLPPAPTTGRERLVAIAIELFYRQGFSAVGIDQILDAAGVTKSTFYKHFESKDDLMVAAVQRRDEWESAAWMRAVRAVAGDDPAKQLLAFFDVMDQWFNDPDFGGCMFISAASEFPNPNDPVHRAAADYKRRSRDHFRNQAKDAGATDPEIFADLYTMIVEGALILRQTHGRNDAAKLARAAAEQLMKSHLPTKPMTAKRKLAK